MGFRAKLLEKVEDVPRFVFLIQAPHVPRNHMDLSHGVHPLFLLISLFLLANPLALLLVGFA